MENVVQMCSVFIFASNLMLKTLDTVKERPSVHAVATKNTHYAFKNFRKMEIDLTVFFLSANFYRSSNNGFFSPSSSVLVAFPFKHFRYFAWLTWKLQCISGQCKLLLFYERKELVLCELVIFQVLLYIQEVFNFFSFVSFSPMSHPKWFETWNSI